MFIVTQQEGYLGSVCVSVCECVCVSVCECVCGKELLLFIRYMHQNANNPEQLVAMWGSKQTHHTFPHITINTLTFQPVQDVHVPHTLLNAQTHPTIYCVCVVCDYQTSIIIRFIVSRHNILTQ